ncbi:MAG TPA: CpsD/CapB family tyrosine-protein kinase [Steroidobacteraceae bacterium]|nr:CpsD/CapB family tyrosine-protein kinase [Steroidobacteraceae bacterium]
MDRIRKALDLARQERDRRHDPVAGQDPADGIPHPSSLAAIDYRVTQVFTPRPGQLESTRILDPSGSAPAAHAFRMLRTQVLQRMEENGWRSLAVLSPVAADGKSTVAINLAACLANDRRHTVLLVDADLKSPAVARTLGIDPPFGIDDVLLGEARVEQCLYHPAGFDRLVVLPARSPLANSSELLAGPRGRALAAELRGRYADRLVVYDLPPVLLADDALAFLQAVECGLMVVSERGTRREDLVRCMEIVGRTPIVGTVLNRASDFHQAYG